MCVTTISLCFDDQLRRDFGLKQEAHLRWPRDSSRLNWEEFVCCQVRANENSSKAKRQLSDRNRAVLLNVQSPRKWWSTLKSTVFGWISPLPRLVAGGKADQLSDHFDSMQPRESVDMPLTCHPSPSLIPSLSSGRVRSGVFC